MKIRSVERRDVYDVIALIKGLALYENAPEEVINTPENLAFDLFDNPICEAIVAESAGKIIGFALYYTSYSTWKGRCIYLEDLFVLPEFRKQGAGSLLFDEVVSIARERKVKRMDWQVLEWNEPAIRFYKNKQALIDNEWLNGRFFF